MPKKEAKVAEVLEASKEILASNGGKMPYENWRKALEEKVGAHENSLTHIHKNKLVLFWLKGFKEGTTLPDLWVVNDKALMLATTPLVEPKTGGK